MRNRMTGSNTSVWSLRLAGLGAALLLGAFAVLLVFLAPAAGSSASAVPVKVGLVTDVATLADGGFNWFSYQGLLRAESELGVVGQVYTSTSEADYGPNLQQCADDDNDLCISVGFPTADAISVTAVANPGTSFAIVDVTFDHYPSNLRGMGFAAEEVGYLAGTLAGLMTESEIVGSIGGMEIAPVQAFLAPYRNGARCANAGVATLTAYSGSFGDPDLGEELAQDLMAAGADVIFAAAGATGNGAVLTTTQLGVWAIGVDTDQWVSLFMSGTVPGSDRMLSSAMKRVDNAVFDTISDVVDSAFTSGTVVYDLAADGVGLAPFHEADASVPQIVRDELDAVKQGIIDGAIDVHRSCPESMKVGLVTDEGTLADMGLNWASYQGLLRAENELGVVSKVYTCTSEADYEPNLQQCVVDGNELCISVGFLTTDAISATAAANLGRSFAIVDATFERYPWNLRGMGFAAEEVGYLAGTLAGLMTESGIVGGIGGMEIPPVQAFLAPYRNGAQCANAGVTVLITYTGTFTDRALGEALAQDMMSAGVDVIFAAAGATGNGAVLTTTQSGFWAIGVDADQWVTLFDSGGVEGSEKLLSSAMKKPDNAVFDTISDMVDGTFTPGTVVYDLAAGGVGLAPFHEAEASVPQAVRDALTSIEQGIVDGSIDVYGSCFYIYLPVVIRSR